MVNSIEIGKELRRLRGDRSQSEVGAAIGVSASAIQMYEAGDRVPRDETKIAYAAYYNTTVGALFFNEKVHELCTERI